MHPQDQTLLLLAHGELPFAHGALVHAHLLLCPRCRARVARFRGASRLMAGAIRGHGMPPWPGPPASALVGLQALAAWLLVLTVTLSLAALVVFGAIRLSHSRTTPGTSSTPSSSGGCRPDLPSDQCR